MSEALDFAAMEHYRFKSDGLTTRTSVDQEECESSCNLFFFPLPELPLDQQLQLQQLSFVNTDLEVRGDGFCLILADFNALLFTQPLLMREKHIEYLKRGLTRLPAGFVSLDARYPLDLSAESMMK